MDNLSPSDPFEIAFRRLDAEIAKLITTAKEAGVPQGLLVALLHGYAHIETAKMVLRD
jgi:hypothetical protein